MAAVEELKKQRAAALDATAGAPPPRTVNPFFGVGPITNMLADEVERRLYRFEFEAWLEANYPKVDDTGKRIGPVTAGELDRCMHRGYPADKVVADMMREIHRYFGFSKQNVMAVGLGGGHSGFTVAVLHLLNSSSACHVFVDTPKPETDAAQSGGAFRQSWGVQLLELQRFTKNGDEGRVHFSRDEGQIPTAEEMEGMGIKLFVGVGLETTGATTYNEQDIRNLLAWLNRNPNEYHAVIDAASVLGAMPWTEDLVQQVMSKCCLFMPVQKAIGGTAGYFIVSLTPEARSLVEQNVNDPSWSIPRQLKLAIPENAKLPISSKKTTALGPFYDPAQDKMLGGIINTFSAIAFAETTFGLLQMEKKVGSVRQMNQRSVANRQFVSAWAAHSVLFEMSPEDESRRGAAVTLLKVNDPDITDADTHGNIIAKTKQLLGFEGLTHPNGEYEPGLDVARYVNAFPGTPGDFRLWTGGARPESDIAAVLDNLEYCYQRAKVVVLEEQLAPQGVTFKASVSRDAPARKDDPNRVYKVLIADMVGFKFAANGKPDYSAVRTYIEEKGGVFHDGPIVAGETLSPGIHFFYQPDLSRDDEILPQTDQGQYDALIAAATCFPKASVFNEGGVRIGAGTGNMGSDSWGRGSGAGGVAPLMNTPSFNSRATAHMAFKGLLKAAPDLDVATLHQCIIDRDFDTDKNLKEFPIEKIEGKRMAVIGFGNIGCEMAQSAHAFNLEVVVHDVSWCKEWAESEGFTYAASVKEAAQGVDFITIHTGLGAPDPNTGKFSNENIIDGAVLNSLNDGAVVVNYDRGELINAQALDDALASGKVRYAAIDADMFKHPETGAITGPIAPYLDLEKKYRGRMELLPHATTDTEHSSRVEGAKQTVDQIMRVIQYKEVVNLKGDLPAGYTDAGAQTVDHVGSVSALRLAEAVAEDDFLANARKTSERLAAIWGSLSATTDPERRAELLERYGSELIFESNRYATLVEGSGLKGPYRK